MRPNSWLTLIVAGLIFEIPTTTFAYIGPGGGLGAIGTVVALIFAVLLAIVGFMWYPLKRLLRKRRHTGESAAPGIKVDDRS